LLYHQRNGCSDKGTRNLIKPEKGIINLQMNVNRFTNIHQSKSRMNWSWQGLREGERKREREREKEREREREN
jgi:hypothetical protein